MKSKVKDKRKLRKNWNYYICSVIYLPILLIQLILTIFFFYWFENLFLLMIGIVFIISFVIFGWLPIHTLKIKGKSLGKSFAETTQLVMSGLYKYIRHPQFLSWIFLSIGLSFLSQHLIVLFLTIPITILIYIDALIQDRYLIKKFDQEYKTYMEKVPRINPIMNVFM